MNLRETALQLFMGVFQTIDAEKIISGSIRVENSTLNICDERFDLTAFSSIFVVSFGKAGMKMAQGLQNVLGEKITRGIVSAPKSSQKLPPNWQVFHGGHPVPNEESITAAQKTIELLIKSNNPHLLILFLISGGGSAMLELPRDDKISLTDLKKTNLILVNCGAPINEINKFRKAISQIKGGGLIRICPLARKVSLIISDTNQGDLASIASGATIEKPEAQNLISEAIEVAEKYQFKRYLPISVIDFLENYQTTELKITSTSNQSTHLLLDNQIAVESVAKSAGKLGFITEMVDDLIENPIEDGCRKLVKRLLVLKAKNKGEKVAIISGGEFTCPVRGEGIGGRNLETVLRCLLELQNSVKEKTEFTVLSCGTDGIDGNSPAAGAVSDNFTLGKAAKAGLKPESFLVNSDCYNFFREMEELIITGNTGTNVRDLRILLAS